MLTINSNIDILFSSNCSRYSSLFSPDGNKRTLCICYCTIVILDSNPVKCMELLTSNVST